MLLEVMVLNECRGRGSTFKILSYCRHIEFKMLVGCVNHNVGPERGKDWKGRFVRYPRWNDEKFTEELLEQKDKGFKVQRQSTRHT